MNISNIKANLNGQDLISILNDFVKVDGLSFSDININDELEVVGTYKKIFSITFRGSGEIVGIVDNRVTFKIKKVKLMKFGLFKFLQNFALKKALNNFQKQGIFVDRDLITIDINKIMKPFAFISLKLKELKIENRQISAEVENLNLVLEKIGQVSEQVEEVEVLSKEVDYNSLVVDKIEDNYTKGRKDVEIRIPKKLRGYSDYLFILPDILALIYRLMKDKRVSKKTKMALIISFVYISFPVDILPDKLPFIGNIDDLAVIFFAFNRVLNDVPIEIILENWQGKNEFVIVAKNILEYLIKYTGAKNVDKIYSILDGMV